MSNWPDFEVPKSWRIIEAHETAALMKSGGTPSRKVASYWDGDIPFVLIEDMTSAGLYLDRTSERITNAGLDASSAWIVPPGTVLLSMYATIGATVVNRIPLATNQAILAIVPKKDVSAEFLAFCLRAHKSALSARNVQATQKNINKGIVETFPLPIPPLPEQKKIAGVLGLVQRALEQQERLIALTTELKKALLHQLFTQGLRGEPQKQAEIGPVPQSWEVVTLGSLAKVGNGSTPKRDNEGYWQGGTIPWLNSAKIHERFITEADQFVTGLAVKECHLPRVKSGSLLIAITGQGKTLGNSALVSFETCINQHLAYAQFISPKMVPEFVLWFMQTRYEHLRSISQAGGSTKGALTCGYLKTYPIPLPALDEQREIVGVFAALDRKEKVHERKHAALTALFRTLLHQLMTAQLRVHDLDLGRLNNQPF
jgi:type I restriction enzyme S subunit